jgi:PPK2 family polyphosphate:nucleotide phosphotransferase
MKIQSKSFRVKEGEKVGLNKWPTRVQSFYKSEEEYETLLEEHIKELNSLQQRHYASNTYALLVIFQAMDAAGKDGIIRHVMSGINPQGCQVSSFKHPSATELDHDFLWRTTQQLPERGMIGVFNRSYYEEVLIVRVHPEILRGQAIPDNLLREETVWEERYHSIRDFEAHIHRNGTKVIKVFLHISKDEQRKRFLARIDDPRKNWKFGEADMREREFWKDYIKAYEDCLGATSTQDAPWFVVPADDKKNARLIAAQIVLDTLRSLNPRYPEPTKEFLLELQAVRKKLLKEGKDKKRA